MVSFLAVLDLLYLSFLHKPHAKVKILKFNLYFNIMFRNQDCDIRIQLPNVSKEHTKLSVDDNNRVSSVAHVKSSFPLIATIAEKVLSNRSEFPFADRFPFDRCDRSA